MTLLKQQHNYSTVLFFDIFDYEGILSSLMKNDEEN